MKEVIALEDSDEEDNESQFTEAVGNVAINGWVLGPNC